MKIPINHLTLTFLINEAVMQQFLFGGERNGMSSKHSFKV